jgi:hypothetical protein
MGLRSLILLSLITATRTLLAGEYANSSDAGKIDRQALVTRHNVTLTKDNHDPRQWLQVGNCEIAFGIGIDGLQTFTGLTMSHWGWHTNPLPEGKKPGDFRLTEYDTYGRKVGYPTDKQGQEELYNWLRENPHRFNLGRFLLLCDGKRLSPSDISDFRQNLDLWSGVITSTYELRGEPVTVETCAHPRRDLLAVRIRSPLVESNRLSVMLWFPYGSPDGSGGDFGKPDAHATTMSLAGEGRARFARQQNQDAYAVDLAWSGEATLKEAQPHQFILKPEGGVLEVTCEFSATPLSGSMPSFDEVKLASEKHWPEFWNSGGAIDLSESKDPRWKELERRIVLSQYLLAVNEAGSHPPQEAGLYNNGWNGKFHLEMHWWHGTHYALWDRWEMFDRSLWWYRDRLPVARQLANSQGYRGARWPKMVGPNGIDSPSRHGPLLIWQQPHPIYYANLDYRLHPTRQTLEKWQDVVFETADFLVDFAWLNPETGFYELGPPLITVAENNDVHKTRNPLFELSYWKFGLRIARTWREKLGLPPDAIWNEVHAKLAPLPQDEGLYLQQEGSSATMWRWWNNGHPALVGAFGMLPGDGVDPAVMKPTVKKVMEVWQMDACWGWDYPMIAMAAARTSQPSLAIDALLHPHPKNNYTVVGNNTGGGSAYYPANGGLLYAVAMMAAGWDGGPEKHAPGFPDDGSWVVKWEGLRNAQ